MDLAETLEARAAWPELVATLDAPSGDTPTQAHSAFVLFVAQIANESPAALAAAMDDPHNAAGRALKKLEHQAAKGERQTRAGRPKDPKKLFARLLDVLTDGLGGDRPKRVANGLKKLGHNVDDEQAFEISRKARKEFRSG